MTKIAMYFDMRNPPGWRQGWHEYYEKILGYASSGDEAGLDAFWVTEHHFFEDGYLPQPLTFLAAVAARTKKMRLGTAVMLAPLRKSIQIAEEAAIVDILSNGRLELGLGTGYRKPEFDPFDAPFEHRWDTTDQRIREIRDWWEGGRMMPPMVQKRAPIWCGYQGPKGALRAGRLGENLLSLYPQLYEPYVQGIREAGLDASRAVMGGPLHGYLVDDPEKAWDEIGKHVQYQWDSYKRYGIEGTGKPFHPVNLDDFRAWGEDGALPPYFLATPEQMAKAIRERLAGLPIDTIFMWSDIAGLPNHWIERHLELIPRLKAALGDLASQPAPEKRLPWQARLIVKEANIDKAAAPRP